jgi:hypothetical protein
VNRPARWLWPLALLAQGACTIEVTLSYASDAGAEASALDVSARDGAWVDADGMEGGGRDAPEVDASADGGEAPDGGDAGASAWMRVPVPTFADLRGVWGSGPRDVWIVGDRGALLRWNGASWTPYPSPVPNVSFRDVWGTAADDVWAVGYEFGGSLVILRWNGARWTRDPLPPTRYIPRAISGTSRNDAWIVGGPTEFAGDTVLRWDGIRWSTMRTGGRPTRYLDVGGAAPTDVWMLALDDTLLRWDGTQWTSPAATLPVAVVSFELGLWAVDVGELWLTGDAGTLHRYRGGAWSSVNAGTTNLLRNVWGLDRNTGWAVGSRGTIARWDGTSWTALEEVTGRALLSVWASAANDAWVVGESGTVLHSIR